MYIVWIIVIIILFILSLIYGYYRFIVLPWKMNGSPTPSNNQPKKFDESKLRFKTVFKYHENDGIINNKNTYTAKIYQNEIVIIDVNHNLKFTSTTRIPFSIVKNVDITDVIDRQGELYFKIETNERPLKSTDGGNEYLSSSNSEIIIANLAGGDDAETIRKNAANFKNAIEKALEEYKQTDEYQNEIKAKKENRNSDFYRKFKNKYGLDFEKWNEEKEIINLCRKEWDNVYSNYTIVIFKNSFFSVIQNLGKNTILPIEEKLIVGSKLQLGDEYNEMIKTANFDEFSSLLYPLDDIVSIKFIKNINETHLSGHVSGLDMAVKSELFGTGYAIGDAMEKMEGTTFKTDDSYYKLLFKTNPVQTLCIYKGIFEMNDTLKNHKHKLEVEMAKPKKIEATKKGQTSVADEIKKAKQLLDDGVITKEEFDALKAKLLK